jgi:S1-C subfamily serine protease
MSATTLAALKGLALVALFAVVSIADAKETRRFYSGGWLAGAYSDDRTGAFSYCYGAAGYENSVVMSVVVDRTYSWGLLFAANHWHLTLNTEIPVKYKIDTSPWFDTKAKVVEEKVVYVPVPQETTLVELFRHGRLLQLNDGIDNLFFNLTGTARLLVDLGACVDSELAQQTGGVGPAPRTSESSADASRAKPSGDAGGTESSSGSGIFISESGYVLTNDHVIDGCRDLWVRRNGDIGRSASIVARDAANDLALLASDGHVPAADVAAFRTGGPIRAGDPVAAYGFPLAGTLSSTGNVVSGNVTALTGVGDDVRYFQISAPVQPGNSGGPLLDYSGLVVGIVNAKLNELAWASKTGDIPQNVNFAIKENVILGFLEAHSIAYRSFAPLERLDLPGVTDRAQRFTAYVACVR